MNKRRLLKLADLLEADARSKKGIKFDMGTWGDSRDGPPGVNCGTSACAMGLAALSGVFRRQGLKAKVIHSGAFGVYDVEVMFGRSKGHKAAVRLFNIADAEARFLFMPSSYDGWVKEAESERVVAKRIRDFVAGKVAP